MPRCVRVVVDFSVLTQVGRPDNVPGPTGAIRFVFAGDATVPALVEWQLEIP